MYRPKSTRFFRVKITVGIVPPLLNIEAEREDEHEIPIFQDIKAFNCPLKELDTLKFRDVSVAFNGEIGGYDNVSENIICRP
jgi:hypothetical protein